MSEPITADLILYGYTRGVFPMADPDTGEIAWYSPDPRGIIPIDTWKPKRSLRNLMNRGWYEFRINTDFDAVIRHCANRDETWISNDIIHLYTELHHRGFAHSVEVWRDGELRGGLYGVAINGAFFGESMFSLESNTSKLALHFLVQTMKHRGLVLLDTQWITSHLDFLGGVYISRQEYMRRLSRAMQLAVSFL
ncbi:MAG: leucyl/phenylalanyl-tRNA--protein transferase [Bacteroidetes bacterium]|nr:leucyl/phenylalanyl-tRNA--protein transferase [Bacteroidota bacterium]